MQRDVIIAARAIFGALFVAAILGCGRGSSTTQAGSPSVSYVTASEAARMIATPGPPTVLEFCVPLGCYRCDAMREPINTLADSQAGRLRVARINLHTDAGLARRWGVTACPTYVVFDGGQEVARAVYPTSADLIAALIPESSAGSAPK